MEQETRNRERGERNRGMVYLGDHLVLEDLLLVEDLDGDILAGLDVPGELDLGEGAFAEGPAELVPPHPGPAHGRAHLLSSGAPAAAGGIGGKRRRRPLRTTYVLDPKKVDWCARRRRRAAGLRPFLVAGPPLDEQLLVLLALLPMPHQASPRSARSLAHWCVSAAAARCGMGRQGIGRGREGNGGWRWWWWWVG